MAYLFPNIYLIRELLQEQKYADARILANYGISLITKMYAGRGGALDGNKLIPNISKMLSQYFDALYWSYTSDNPHIPKSSIQEFRDCHTSTLFLLSKYFNNLHIRESYNCNNHSLINDIISSVNKIHRVYITCAWTDTETLYKNWNHLFETLTIEGKNYLGFHNGTIKEFQKEKSSSNFVFILTNSIEDADYIVAFWASHSQLSNEQLKKTIFLRSEPIFPEIFRNGNIDIKCEPLSFLKYFDYSDIRYPNCAEYWLPGKPSELLHQDPTFLKSSHCDDFKSENKISEFKTNFDLKSENKNAISAVVSSKYNDPGHRLRIDLLKFITEKSNIQLRIYGHANAFNFPPNIYKGSLPNYDKSDGLYYYRYHLTAENHAIRGYFTEKIIDGILSECLVFYWGCPNIQDYFPEVDGVLPYVLLPMDDKEKSLKIIEQAIEEDWWEKRLTAIKETKKIILTKFLLQHRIANVITEEINKKILGLDGINLLNLSRFIIKYESHYKTYFPTILYNGARCEELSKMIYDDHTLSTIKTKKCELKKFTSLCDRIPDNTPFMQEFANELPNTHIHNISQYRCQCDNSTLQYRYNFNYSMFSIKNFIYPNSPKAFVINLNKRPDRYKKFELHFPLKCGLKCERFDAVDGYAMKEKGFSEPIKYLFRNNDFNMKPGVVGCALSHIKLWKKLVTEDKDDFYLIYEDDVEFAASYEWKLFSLMQSAPASWDVLFLGHLICYEELEDHRMEENGLPVWESMVNYMIPKRTSWVGTASYMISKRGAQKLLDALDDVGVNHGIDYFMQVRFEKVLRAYAARPMLNFAEYKSPLNPNEDVDSDVQC